MYFQKESYTPQLFARKFSPREPKCLKWGSGKGLGWPVPYACVFCKSFSERIIHTLKHLSKLLVK